MPRTKQLTKDDYIKIGERFRSSIVLQEARLSVQRWTEDLALLTTWGWGPSKLQKLQALIAQLSERQTLYAAQVGAKLAAVPTEAALARSLRDWCLRGLSILDDLIQERAEVAKAVDALGAEVPLEAVELCTYGSGLLALLTRERAQLPPEAADEPFFQSGRDLLETLPATMTAKVARRDTKEVATSELDELDGRIYDLLVRLNENGRRAHRQAGNEAKSSQYVLYYLTATPREAGSEPDTAPYPPESEPGATPGSEAPPAAS
jgi:hypothetical protein